MGDVTISTNTFDGVPFPLVVADQFFHIYDRDGRFMLDLFRWDEATQTAIYEVLASVPQVENIDTNPTGIVTVGDSDDGGFLFKFRPKPGVSQIFGKVPTAGELTVHCSDHALRVMRGDQMVMDARSNRFSGMAIGVLVGADGSIGMGVNWLPPGMVLVPRVA